MKKALLFLLCFCFYITMYGCGKEEPQGTQPPALEQHEVNTNNSVSKAAIKTSCEDFIKAYATNDGVTVGKLLNGDDTPVDFSGLNGILAANMDPSIEIQDISVENGEATVQANVKNIDLAKALSQVPDSIQDKDAASAYLRTVLTPGNNEKIVYPVSILLIQHGDQWQIQMTPSLSNALLAGYNDLLTEGMEGIER